MKKFKTYNFLVIASLFLVLQACNVKKSIPEGKRLYTGGKVEMESGKDLEHQKLLKQVLEDVLQPEPNKKILGMRLGLYYYYKMQGEDPGFLTKFLYRKIGEKPVYQSDVEEFEVQKLLLNRLENRGFFYSTATSNFEEKEKTASIKYNVKISSPYKMNNYKLDSMPEPAYAEIKKSFDDTYFKKGMRYDLSYMKMERERIDRDLKKAGYYNFNGEFLKFEADTTEGKNKEFELYLGLKESVPERALVPYKIAKINVYAKYDSKDSTVVDLVRYNDKNYINSEDYFKSKYLDPFITLEEGQYYDALESKNTTRRLSTIGLYKYVSLQFKEIDSSLTDSEGALEANIYLSSLNRRALRAELQAVTKSNNFAGPGLNVTSTSRNLFKGGEMLNVTAKGSYEFQAAAKGDGANSSLEAGLKAEVVFPRVIFFVPIKEDFFKYNIPKTKTSVEGNFLRRSKLYTVLSGTGLFGYSWQANKYVHYEINPISVNYTKLFYTSSSFDEILDNNPFIKSSFDQKLIAGMTSSYTYNGLVDTDKKHQFYFNTNMELAGNSISLLGRKSEDTDKKNIIGLEYAQFAKADLDIRYHLNFGNERLLAARVYGGYGLAYGNSDIVPYIKQFYSGGPYSVRAFRIRALGPGTFSEEDNPNISYFDQTGNIRLEANLEYRFPIYSFIKGAVFADAGNVWNSHKNDMYNGKDKFTSSFISELGMGAGVGVRVDVQGFVIRFDLASPFHDPSLPKGSRYTFNWGDTVLNFAIGYPF